MPKEYVVLLHGLARTRRSMRTLETALLNAGFGVANQSYASTSYPIEQLARRAISSALALCPDNTRIHFVTHSMGGILVRQYLKSHTLPNLGRVVMLGPPNQGSEIVDVLGRMPGFALINGPAGLQLSTDKNSVPAELGQIDFECGVIAGTRTINLLLSRLIPGQNDGKVSVENTKVAGMKDHIVLPVAHPFMMANSAVIRQVVEFLKHGQFNHEPYR